MAKSGNIPAPAVWRLSLYLRQLEYYVRAERLTISSRELGEALGLSDAQVRKDLTYFGQFGQPGIGYPVEELVQRVRRILGTDRRSAVILAGVGNLGRALASFRGFDQRGFEIVALFDRDEAKVGQTLEGPLALEIQHPSRMREAVTAHSARMGILTVPAAAAQGVADEMVKAGVRAILNFAPVALQVDSDVVVSSVDLAIHLEQLSFHVNATPG